MTTRKCLTLRHGDSVQVTGPATIKIEPVERRRAVFRATIEADASTHIHLVRKNRQDIPQNGAKPLAFSAAP